MTSPYRPDERWGDYGQYGQTWAVEQPQSTTPEPPRRRNGRTVALVTAVLALVAAIGVVMVTRGTEHVPGESTAVTGEAGARPGDCVEVDVAGPADAGVRTVDCASPEAIYEVATREETDSGECPSDQYVSYTEEGRLRLCLRLNVRDGECIQVTESGDRRVDCASPDATYRVVSVLDGVADPARCDTNASDVIVYPAPPRTVCLAAPAK
jgi:hypothetical protein